MVERNWIMILGSVMRRNSQVLKIIEHRGLNNLVEIVTGHLLWLSFVPRRFINQRSFDAYVKHGSGLTRIPDPNLIRQVGVKAAIL